MDAVSPILVERAREPQGLRNMWILSLVVHGVATAMLLMMPTPSLEDDARTGTVQPEAAISPADAQRTSSTPPAARLAPPVNASTILEARGSCLA